MGLDLHQLAAAAVAVVAVALLIGLVLTMLVHRRGSTSLARSIWIAASVVSAAAVLAITLAPSGQGETSACSLTVDGSVLNWLTAGQPLANLAMLVPLAIALPLATRGSRWHPWSFVALVALPVLIETAQARLPLGRACDLTDVVDNWWGVAIGCALGAAGTALASRRRGAAAASSADDRGGIARTA